MGILEQVTSSAGLCILSRVERSSDVFPFAESKLLSFQLHNNITQLATSLDSHNIVNLRLKATCLGHLIRVNGTLESDTWVLYLWFVLTASSCFLHSKHFFVIKWHKFQYSLLEIFVVVQYKRSQCTDC